MPVMQSAAKHLACIATQNRCHDWITITCEMLRCALHDRFYLVTSLITKLFGKQVLAVMQSAAQYLACGSNQKRCNE